MAATSSAITVVPATLEGFSSPVPVLVAITDSEGSAVTAYTAYNGSTEHDDPARVEASTTFWFVGEIGSGPYTVTCTTDAGQVFTYRRRTGPVWEPALVNVDKPLLPDTAAIADDPDFASQYAPALPTTCVWFGDSYVAAGSDSLADNADRSPLSAAWWTQIISGGRLDVISLQGTGGNTTAQMLARIADVTALSPGIVCLLTSGINDAINGVASATTIANLEDIFDTLRSAGAVVVAGTIPHGTNVTGDELTNLADVNAWLVNAGRTRRGLIIVDVAEAVTDPSSGEYASTLTWDSGVHPNGLGAYAIAKRFAAGLAPLLAGQTSGINRATNDPYELAPNPNLTGTGGSKSGTVTGDSPASTFTANVTATVSKVARTDTPGTWYRVDMASSTGSGFVTQDISSGWAIGDKVQLTVELRLPEASSHALTNLAVYVDQRSSGGSLIDTHIGNLVYSSAVPKVDEVMVCKLPPVVVASGMTGGYLRAGVKLDGAGKVDIGLISVKLVDPA